MPVENPFPLNIGTKQDSWEKLQLLANIDPTFKLVAAEFSLMVQALNYLYENGGGGSGTAVQVTKQVITVGSDVTAIQLTDETFPKVVELHEETGYMPEGIAPNGLYTYNADTGLISFNVTIAGGTNIYITKFTF
jgi:hypothetical protein